jgi:class 3 adenylate cyclase
VNAAQGRLWRAPRVGGCSRLADRRAILKAIARLSEGAAKGMPPVRDTSAGERRQVTALFADLAGFTRLST